MSADSESTDDVMMCCASCGKAEVDNIKLKKCACNLVKYCSVDCQRNHRPQHKKTCKKRLAEIRDDKLFTQPDGTHLGECPICCLPLPLNNRTFTINTCCSKRVCNGCACANLLREREQGLESRCPYCRESMSFTEEEGNQCMRKRAKANDSVALYQMGMNCDQEGDYEGAFEYWTTAAELGEIMAHHSLSYLYREGKGVEKDAKKEMYHLEGAAIGGHHIARYNLALYEWRGGRFDIAFKHWLIAAKQGYDDALEPVKEGFALGVVSKEDYEAALRGHQAAVDATKSEQRDAAGRYYI